MKKILCLFLFLIVILSAAAEFSIDVSLEQKNKITGLTVQDVTAYPGQEVAIKIRIAKTGSPPDEPVDLVYTIEDQQGKIIVKESDRIIPPNELEFIKLFPLPNKTASGMYNFTFQLLYKGNTYSTKDQFLVAGTEQKFSPLPIIIILISVVFAVYMRKHH